MKKFKEVISKVFDYLFEILIYFSFMWAVLLVVIFTYLIPDKGFVILAFAFVMVTLPRVEKWIISRKEVNQQ